MQNIVQNFIHTEAFKTFIADLVSGIIILIIGTTIIPCYLDWRKKPRLKLVNSTTGKSNFFLTKSEDGYPEATLNLSTLNESKFIQRNFFWHILIPGDLDSSFEGKYVTPCSKTVVVIDGQEWSHYYGSSTDEEFILPRRSLKFNYLIKIKSKDSTINRYKLYYYFITEFGYCPSKSVKMVDLVGSPKKSKKSIFSPKYFKSIELDLETS